MWNLDLKPLRGTFVWSFYREAASRPHALNIRHSPSFPQHHTFDHTQPHTFNTTHLTSHTQHHILNINITHLTSHIQHHTQTSHTQHHTLNITHSTSHNLPSLLPFLFSFPFPLLLQFHTLLLVAGFRSSHAKCKKSGICKASKFWKQSRSLSGNFNKCNAQNTHERHFKKRFSNLQNSKCLKSFTSLLHFLICRRARQVVAVAN